MSIRSIPRTRLTLLAALITLTFAGCATKEFVQQEVGGVNKRIDELSALLSTAKQRIDDNSGRIGSTEARISNAEQVAAFLSRRVEQVGTGLTDAGKRIEDVTGRLQRAEQRIATNSGEIARAHERLDDLETRLSATNDRVEGAAARITQAESGIETLHSALKDMSLPAAAASVQAPAPAVEPPSTATETARPLPAVGDAYGRLDDIAAQIAAARQRIDTNANALDAASERLTRVEAKLDDTRAQVERSEAGLTAAHRRIDETQGQLTAVEQRVQANTAAITSVGQRTDTLQDGLGKALGRLDSSEETLMTTREKLERVQSALDGHDERLTRNEQALATAGDQIAQALTALKQQDERLARNEAEDARISATAREALERAMAAGKLAEGKLVYETVMTEVFLGYRPYRTELSDAAKQALKRMVDKLTAENQNIYIEIQGYTDSSGDASTNLRLGQQRAEGVRNYLYQVGLPLHRMNVISYGSANPIADNGTKEGRAKNRRVAVVVLK
ncbi:MAG: OmpA family protein [Thiobacillaceae bacterium]